MTGDAADVQAADQRLRVFVSSVISELATERARVREAIVSLRLIPVMAELGAQPHPPRALYARNIDDSDVFIGLYGERYGWVAPAMTISGLEDEYDLADKAPRLLYVKRPAPGRDKRLTALIERIEAEGSGSYRTFSTPDELVDLVRDDLALLLTERFTTAAVAALGAPARRPGLLPTPATPIVGREQELADVCKLLGQSAARLVTLTGAGGIGKTRLALEVASRVGDNYAGGIAYVQLASIRNAAFVLPTIATAVGATIERGQPALDAITRQVQQPLLLIPDNLEQIEDVGPELADLLTATPLVAVLATSRTPLRIRGEHEYPVPVLDVGASTELALESVSPAVELFVDRARAARAGFELTADNIGAVAEICRRLDGLPLAIELAAARVRLLPPESLLTRLGNRLDTLGSGASDLPERQRTLRSTIDWSFSLLDAGLAKVMTELAVFADGWTLEAAAAVCDLDEFAALDAMEALDRHSLILSSQQGGEPRFRMLATVREYALERLALEPDAEEIAERHAAFYLRLLEQAYGGLLGSDQSRWGEGLAQEQGNLRAVLRRYFDQGAIEQASHVIRALWPFWWLQDQLIEADEWIARALPLRDRASPLARAELLWAAWSTTVQRGDNAGAVRLMDEAVAAIAAVEDPVLEALTLLLRSYTLPITGDIDGAFDASLQALERFRSIDVGFLTGMALTGLGTISQIRGDIAAARRYHQDAVTVGRNVGNKRMLGQALSSLGMAVLAEGEVAEARGYIEESGEVLGALRTADGVSLALSAYAQLALYEGDVRRAAVARGALEEIRRRIGITVWPIVANLEQELVQHLRAVLGDAAYEEALAEGAAQTLQEALTAATGRSAEPSAS